jgi:hypothetical protein
VCINVGVLAHNLAELCRQNIWWSPKAKLEQFNFDLIDNLDNNLDSEEWKRPEKRKINFEALRANNYKVELNKSIKYWEAKLIKWT